MITLYLTVECRDIRAVATLLGKKPYIMGDKPSLVDCTVFGALCQVIYGLKILDADFCDKLG